MSPAVSFRDPAGLCIALNGHILRVVERDHVAALEGFLNSACAQKFSGTGNVMSTSFLSKGAVSQWLERAEFKDAIAGRTAGAVFEPERIGFPSIPHECSPQMLYAASELTLDLALGALKCGYTLKDATPS